MVDRQDIDALLVSALYGELTPADEARLTQHLESHPTDRAVLADLTRARAAVRDSRIFDVQIEPPQAVSALLLQEAARRAPRRVDADKPSWFARFVHSLVAHPGLAAAASLVLVVGVAGTLYLKNGDEQFADKTVSTERSANGETTGAPIALAPAARPEVAPSDASVADLDERRKDTPAADEATTRNAGSAYAVDLHDSVANHRAADPVPGRVNGQLAKEDTKPIDALKRQRVTAKPSTASGGLVVRGTERQPKELADNEAKSKLSKTDAAIAPGDTIGGAGASAAPATPTTGFGSAGPAGGGEDNAKHANRAPVPKAEPSKPPAVQPPAATTPAPPPAQVARSADDKKAEQKKDDAEEAWARGALRNALALVQAKKCPDAARVAASISIRAPEFYQQNVAENRDLKPCMAYVNAEREKENDRRAKSRPAKKSQANEVDAPAANQ